GRCRASPRFHPRPGVTADTIELPRPRSGRGRGRRRLMAYAERMAAVRERMRQRDVDMLLLSLGADLPWLTGYTAMPLERLTLLVLPADGEAVLVVPELEAPRVVPRPELFTIRPWSETENPVTVVTGLVGRSRRRLALSDRTWATFLLALQVELPRSNWALASRVTGPLRAVKDADEVAVLRR